MMEVERRKALKEYEEREKAAHFERLKGAQVLQHQITDREQIRLLDEEKKDQETKVIINIFYHQFFRLLGGSLELTFIWEFMKINKICPKILPVLNILKKCEFSYINFVSFNFFFHFWSNVKAAFASLSIKICFKHPYLLFLNWLSSRGSHGASGHLHISLKLLERCSCFPNKILYTGKQCKCIFHFVPPYGFSYFKINACFPSPVVSFVYVANRVWNSVWYM